MVFFFDNSSDAALFINKIWENVEEWWFNDDLQLKVKKFNDTYSKINTNKLFDIKKLISEVKKN